MYFLEKLKTELAEAVNKAIKSDAVKPSDFEYPPEDISKAELALPCFKLAPKLKDNPQNLAKKISAAIKSKWLSAATSEGGYVNFYLKRGEAAEEILKEAEIPHLTSPLDYQEGGKKQNPPHKNPPQSPFSKGGGKKQNPPQSPFSKGGGKKQNPPQSPFSKGGGKIVKKGEKVMLEYVSPNSNKPLHLGHVRNGFLGEALANILEFTGYKVKRTCLVNDRGVAISKAMLAYKLWGRGDSPKKSGLKSDHFVGKYYVLFEQKLKEDESLKERVQELVQKWEAGDKETWALWKKLIKWATDGYEETYKKLGIAFDKLYYEHELYKEGQKMAEEYLKNKIFVRDEKENISVKLSECNLPDKVLLRADGTAVYATTDLALAKKRIEEGFKKIFYVVGSEQDLYFKQLFCILKKMGLDKNLDLRHLSYGMVELPEGKMKSREGTVVDADDLLANLEDLLREELKKRYELLSHYEIEKRTKVIALAALKFYILNVNPPTTIHFNPKESISFTGKTGPYLLYSYARLHSILRKGKNKDKKGVDFSLLKEDELWQLVLQIAKFPEVIKSAAEELNPENLTSYLYDFSAKINDFYHKIPVLEAPLPVRKLRIAVIESVLDVLKQGFVLLGIEPLAEM